MTALPKKDSELKTIEELSERILLIQKQRDALESQGYKNNSISAFQARHAKIAKLTDREGNLWNIRVKLLKIQKN